MKKERPTFKVLTWEFNGDCLLEYDVMPYFLDEWEEEKARELKTWSTSAKDMPTDFEDIKDFIKRASFRQFWSRCEYEMIVSGWPRRRNEEKIDAHIQIMMNLDTITRLFMNYVYGSEA